MTSTLLPFIQKLIAIRSTADDPAALARVLDAALAPLADFTIERFEHNGAPSALVYNRSARPRRFRVLFNAHLDVVPGRDDRYQAKCTGDRLYGVGALDMKANAACMIDVFKRLAPEASYPIALQLTTDEEIGGFDGTKHQVRKGVRADFVIAGEPTNFDIVHKAKGVLWVKVAAKGRTAHGAYPWRGDNAVLKVHDFLNTLRRAYPDLKKEGWVTSVNVSRVSTSNVSLNKIPDDAEVWLDIRFIAQDAGKIVPRLRKMLPTGCKLSVIEEEPPLSTDPNHTHIKALERAMKKVAGKKTVLRGANGTSDARHFAGAGCPGIEFGAAGAGIGSDDEWVSVKSLETYCRVLESYLRELDR